MVLKLGFFLKLKRSGEPHFVRDWWVEKQLDWLTWLLPGLNVVNGHPKVTEPCCCEGPRHNYLLQKCTPSLVFH